MSGLRLAKNPATFSLKLTIVSPLSETVSTVAPMLEFTFVKEAANGSSV